MEIDEQRQKRFMVQKKNGRLEPFEIEKMARAISRAGMPFVMARDISKLINEDLFHSNYDMACDHEDKRASNNAGSEDVIIPSSRLRELVTSELANRNQSTIAESYSGYNKKNAATIPKVPLMNDKFDSKVSSYMNTHAKQYVKDKDNTSGRGSKTGSH